MTPACFVLVLNYNGRQLGLLDDCFGSLLQTRYPNSHYLLVDNGSTDDSVNYVRHNYPIVNLLLHEQNLGFAEGNNRGIQYSLAQGADYIILLNNDTRVEEDWLTSLVNVAEQNQKIGLCESQQHTWDGCGLIQHKLKPEWMEGVMSIEPLPANPGAPHPTAYAAGCCMLIRRSVVERIGMFDPRYFAYDEDVDFSLRAWIAGFDVYKVPSSIVYHKGGVTLPTIQQMRLGYKNQLFTLFKDCEIITLRRFARSILKRWVFTRNRYALQGMFALFWSFGTTIRLRREVQALRVRADEEIFHLSGLMK
jgi:hypothetical protein